MGETGTPVKIRPENEMSEYSAKTLREKMKAKARSLANPGNYYKDQEVSSADWSPAPPLKTEMKTGARPIMKPSSKGTGESYAARDTKKAIGADMKRGAFKAGGAVKDAGVKDKAALGAIDPSPKRGPAGHYKKGGKVKKNIGGILEKISPAYAVMRSIQRGPDEEQQTKDRLQQAAMMNQQAAMMNAARGAKKGGKVVKKAGGGSMLEKLVGKPKTGSDMSQVGKMGSARYPTEEKETMKEIISPRDTTKETVETMERLGEAGRKKGGRAERADGGNVKIPSTQHKFDSSGKMIPPARYDIYNTRTGKIVGKAKSRTGSTRAVDRRDNDYGAYAHRAVPIYEGASSDQQDSDRAERKAGGRTRAKGKTNINIVIAAGRKAGPEAPALDMAGGMPSAPANIPVPMPGAGAPPPAAMPMGGPPGMPAPGIPGMPPGRKAGGRITKVASSYKDMQAGAASGEGRLQKTDIAKKHHDAPARKRGGKVYSSYKDMDAGAGSGPGRLEKTEIEKKQRARGK